MFYIILYSLLAFFGSIATYVCLSRLFKITAEIKSVLAIYFITSTALFLLYSEYGGLSEHIRSDHFLIYSFVLYTMLYGSFAMTLPALMIEIPTFKIVRLINEQPGINAEQIKDNFTEEELHTGRVKNLIQDNLIEDINGTYKLTVFGKLIAKFFLLYRELLGLRVGKG